MEKEIPDDTMSVGFFPNLQGSCCILNAPESDHTAITLHLKSEDVALPSGPGFRNSTIHYLVLINRAAGLYGRILTEVASTDRTQ